MTKNGSEITCAMCRKAIIDKDQERRIVEVIDGTVYNFDSGCCVLMFKKFRNVYGISFIEA
jgi:type I restriction-modification system DNA methylase subunit